MVKYEENTSYGKRTTHEKVTELLENIINLK